MRIGLCDIDSHNWPNLCLMKLSAYHKARGDHVEWWRPEGQYDRVYKSRVFTDTYSKDTITVTNAGEVVCGGTGYGPRPQPPGRGGAYLSRLQHLSAVFWHCLRLSQPGLSAKLRILFGVRQGGTAEHPGGRPR